jgi:hypothetical protein
MLLPLLSILVLVVVCFRLFVLSFVSFLVQGGATQLWIVRITFIMFLFCWEKSWSDWVVLGAAGLLDPKFCGQIWWVVGLFSSFFLWWLKATRLKESQWLPPPTTAGSLHYWPKEDWDRAVEVFQTQRQQHETSSSSSTLVSCVHNLAAAEQLVSIYNLHFYCCCCCCCLFSNW